MTRSPISVRSAQCSILQDQYVTIIAQHTGIVLIVRTGSAAKGSRQREGPRCWLTQNALRWICKTVKPQRVVRAGALCARVLSRLETCRSCCVLTRLSLCGLCVPTDSKFHLENQSLKPQSCLCCDHQKTEGGSRKKCTVVHPQDPRRPTKCMLSRSASHAQQLESQYRPA